MSIVSNIWNNIKSGGIRTIFAPMQYYIESLMGKIGRVQTEKVSAVFSAIRILSDNLSRLPIELVDTEPTITPLKSDTRYYLLRYKINKWMSSKRFISTCEYHRNTNGNAFARIIRNTYSGKVAELEPLHPAWFTHYTFVNGQLFMLIDHSLNPDTERADKEWINYDDLLHFVGVSTNGIWGINPLDIADRAAQVIGKGEATIDNFYDNNAFSPMVMESKIDTGMDPAAIAAMKESEKNFTDDHLTLGNKGKMIRLPWNKTLKPISINMADAEINATIERMTDSISNIFNVPNFMLSGSDTQKNIEEQTLYFKAFCIAPIADIYATELNIKLLSKDELLSGRRFSFDGRVLIEMDIKTLTTAARLQVTAGMASLNEGIRMVGNKPINTPTGDLHFVQQQNQAIENYDEWKATSKKTNNDGNNESK